MSCGSAAKKVVSARLGKVGMHCHEFEVLKGWVVCVDCCVEVRVKGEHRHFDVARLSDGPQAHNRETLKDEMLQFLNR
jgi:hypothetical protein